MGRELDRTGRPPILVTRTGGHRALVLKPGATVELPRSAVDVTFVFDTTGSMSDKIEALVGCLVGFVRDLAGASLDWRISAVPFGDLTVSGDRIVGDLPYVGDLRAAEQLLRSMPGNNGGGNDGESSLEAVMTALHKPMRQEAVKVIVVITDEPALQAQLRPRTVEVALKQAGALTFVASPPLGYFQRWAAETGGRWYEIGPHFDGTAILAALRCMVSRVARVASDVHRLAGGSVHTYLQLPPARRE